MQGCSQIFECIHIEALQRKFGESTMVSYYLCVSEMSLPHFPRSVVTKPSGYLKSDEVFCEIHQRMTNPCSKEDIISMHHICALDIYNCLKKCSDSLITITDLIFNESFNILSFNTLRSYDIFSECFQRIIVFMQMFLNSPYIDNISNIFLTICPSAYHKKEIEFWQNINYDGPFEKDNTSVTDNKSKYEYTSTLKKSPNRTQKFKDIADDFSERKVDTFIERKGPYSYSRKGILMWFAFLGVLLIHIVFTYMIQRDYRTAIHTSNSISNTYELLHQLANITSFGPLIDILYDDPYRDDSLYTQDTFNYIKNTINDCMLFFDEVRRYHFSIYDSYYFQHTYKFMSGTNVDVSTTIFQQLYQNVIYLYETVLDLMGSYRQELNISQQVYCGYVQHLHQFNSQFYQAISSAENYPKVILHHKAGILILIHSFLYLFVLAIIIILFHAGYKREHSFYYELKKVSKSFLVKLKAFYKKVSESSLEIENQFVLAKKNDETITKPIYLPFLSLVYLPTLLLFIFSVLTIIFSVSSMNCFISTMNNRIESYGYLISFELCMSKSSLDSILTIRNQSCSDISDTLKEISQTLEMMSNHSDTKYGKSTPLCKLCFPKYFQIFSDSQTLIEQESSIFLKLLSNVLISINNTNTTLSGATRSLIFNSFYTKIVDLVNQTSTEIVEASTSNVVNQPIIYFCFHFIFFILIIIYLVYIFMLQTHFDIPYFVLSLTLSNAKMINGNCTISDLIEESFDLSTKKEEKKLQNCTKEFCDKMTTPVMIIDCELKLLYSNDEASRIFLISKEFKDNLSLFEILKDGFIEEGTNKKIGQLINEFAYREFHTIRTYKILGSINSVSDHILTAKGKNMKINYELSIFPIYTTQKHFSQLILIFTPEAEFANYSNFLAKYRKLPITIRNEWIMKDFQITQLKRSNIIKETKSGIVAIVRVKTDFGEKAPQIIDQVFRRFDVIISQSKVFRYYRTHASMYCFGTDFSHEMEFTPYIIHKIILIIRQMFDEAGKVSLSKNVDVDAFSSVGFGNVIIGIPGKEHPFLEVWGAAITDALDMIKVAKLNKVMIRKRVLDQNNLSGIMPELVIPMK
ncbi:hypothetical protein TVAG_437110 [Trichomonas vaginalis G3]|uniref:Guanylate cyclase domain-containing protein n=1 Tax=Trichomonas vaginalis (strain ATCC PRA-98 / G3) TaxID=412133 RepID=A2DFF8_TRIV3|nr:hypothetical protein TVAGG3_0565000 [Trichomonas vaginalis G3]EAY20886.1 hypothetical protein TVAG_437110 [Trichomonas vaginalis G3]KAI5521504.1 hypothetical protein TVAGG3_0565000 [Trichomonas vaginalis G3]|eukprot:XP_001581872.1 hypothetical protein [Trichomonas vaginalis G3]